MATESPIYFGKSCIQTANMYKRYQAASIAEFNAYRVDLDILTVAHCGKIIILNDGDPRALIDQQMIDPANSEYQRFLKTLKEESVHLEWSLIRDPGHVLEFMFHSLKDRLPEEKKAEMVGDMAHYVAIRKERGRDGIKKRMWFDCYLPNDSNNWQHSSGILNIDNCSFKASQVNILHNKQYVYAPVSRSKVNDFEAAAKSE